MNKLLDHFALRLPNGDLYKRRKRAYNLLKKAQEYNSMELIPYAKCLCALIDNLYYCGGKSEAKGLEIINEFLDVNEGMISIKGIKVPKPELRELKLWTLEFYDLLLPYLIPPFDRSYDDAYNEGPYELNENVAVEDGDIVFDCGANMGVFSAIAGSKTPSGKVYCFEPSSFIIEHYLQKTASFADNIIIEKFALSEKIGKMDIFIDQQNIGASALVSINDNKDMEHETVEVTTIDEFVKVNDIPYVSYIKADIEGAERNMLRGATYVLREYAPKLSICTYHFPDDPQVLEKIIKSANPNYIVEHKFLKLYAYCPQK